jgi:hypothetical protein
MSAIDTGISALNNAVAQATGGGPITNPAGAVANLQAAGNVAVTSVGPAIDALSGSNPGVMNLTHMAWVENAKLAGYNNGSAPQYLPGGLPNPDAKQNATQADVDNAVASVRQIATLYGQANTLALSLGYKPSASKPTAARAPTPTFAPMPSAMPPIVPDTVPVPTVTAKRVVVTAGGASVGLIVGARFAGAAVGGPIGFLIGAGLGWILGR